MVLVRTGLDIQINNVYTDDIGRVLILDVKIQDAPFKLVNVYSPNNEDNQVHFYNQVKNMLTRKVTSEDSILLGGDLNLTFNPTLDRKSSTPFPHSRNYSKIIDVLHIIKTTLGLQDIYRE